MKDLINLHLKDLATYFFPIIWNYPLKSYFPKKRGLFAIYVSFCSNKNVISEAILEENVLKKDFSQKLYNFL